MEQEALIQSQSGLKMIIKRVLITGSNSYVGTNVEKWLMKEPDKFYVETISVRSEAWKSFDFSKFDVVFHVAGIAHVSPKKSMKNYYYKVNRDLAIEVAKKTKDSGVGQFIFMSSILVYNSKETRITRDTIPNPDNFYGRSKLEGESGIFKLQTDSFVVSIIRAPLVYGENSKGNFNKLIEFIKPLIFFPNINNKRSVIYILNLCIFVESLIINGESNFYFPQNNSYYSSSKLYKLIRFNLNHKYSFFQIPKSFLNFFLANFSILKKIFGDFYYDFELSNNYNPNSFVDFEKSIELIFRNGIVTKK